jgi:hypothetical protein
VYSKNIGYQFFFITPGPLIVHENFMRNKDARSAIFDYPILYRADTALSYIDSSTMPANNKFVLLDDLSLITTVNSMKADTPLTKKMLNYRPGKWEFEITSSEKGFFCLVQNYYPNW